MELVVKAYREMYTDEEWAGILNGHDIVTRCRDCGQAKEYGSALLCQRMQRVTTADGFCSFGVER